MVLFSRLTYLCLYAIIHLFCFSTSTLFTGNETDKRSLLEFKSQITYDPFEVLSSWNTSLHFCQWLGVTCSRRHQRVTVLNLRSLKLSGSISPHIGNLSFLRELILQNNSFSHGIPPQIGHLRRLQQLSINNNSISGQIPSTLFNCSNMSYIDLSNNNLTGTIPEELGSLLKLKAISLENNKLIGTLPPSMGYLPSLEVLYVDENKLHGVIPDSLGQLINLWGLGLSNNMFSGTIPPTIFNLSSIEIMDVSSNNLQGNLPLGLGISLPNVKFLSVFNNQFTGTIPTSISNATNLDVLQLDHNKFTGRVPSLENLHRLININIAENHLGRGKTDDLKFISTLVNASSLTHLSIVGNNFGAELPQHISNFSKTLEWFGIARNQIYGKIPSGCHALVNLNVFLVHNNKLSGKIPSSFGMLQNLYYLSLHGNRFSGIIPASLGNLTNSLQISVGDNHLQGVIPSNLGNCKNLLELDLSRNYLSGPIPPQIFGVFSLIVLDFSHNLLFGSLPFEVGNLKNLELFNISQNMLSGKLPNSLGSCASLEFLHMDANLLKGSIPSSLSSLRGLRELNISHNNFLGQIPDPFKDMRSLELLDLSYNDFEGIVPVQGIFKNASVVSVAGNKNLCGGIPEFHLPACNFEQPKRRFTLKLQITISSAFLIIIAASIIIYIFICHSRKRKRESALRWDGGWLLKLSYQSLLQATNGFSSDNLIGTGSFGSVYKGILEQEGTVIAVKVLNLMQRGASKSFMAECEMLRNIRHRNLVKVLTACSGVDYGGKDFKALVYEFMVNGSLDDWLHPAFKLDQVPTILNFAQRLNIAIDIASALDYLHQHSGTPIVHCDLKPSNVLLDEEMTAHVSDFGLAKFLSNQIVESSANQYSSLGVRGTIGYCPPEYGVGSEVSTVGDTFSFGIILLEIFTGKRPIDEIFNDGLSLHGYVKRALPKSIMQIIDPNLLQHQLNENATSNFRNKRNNIVNECLISIFEIGISCSAESPQERMNIGDAVAQLSSIRNKLQQIESITYGMRSCKVTIINSES